MTNALETFRNSMPEEMKQQLAERVAADIGRLGAIGGKDAIRITQDKTFELPTGEVIQELSAVILQFVYRNEYYIGAYNKKAISPPACFSISPNAASLAPSPNSPIMQVGEDSTCSQCQWNQFGSSPSGDGKACKNTVFMAVMPPDAKEDSPIWVIKTSPTGVKHFNNYVSSLARDNVPFDAVITKINFDPALSYASLRFSPEEYLSMDTFGMMQRRRVEAATRLAQEPDVSQFEPPKSRK
jgi:hypothetical protein